MNKAIMLAAFLCACAGTAWGQSNCRDIASGGFIQPDEVLMQTQNGYVACRVMKIAVAAKNEAMVTASSSAPAPSPTEPARAPLGVQPSGNSDKSPLVQIAAGYLYNSVNFSGNVSGLAFSTTRVNTSGAFAQVMVNVNRYLSPVGNFDMSYKSYDGSNYLLTYMGGVQAYPLAHGRWSPFGRIMFGAGTLHVSGLGSATGFAWQAGGGLDWKVGRESRLTLRLGTFDWARLSKNGVNANSLKVGTGIVF
jgi:hypothetical protein